MPDLSALVPRRITAGKRGWVVVGVVLPDGRSYDGGVSLAHRGRVLAKGTVRNGAVTLWLSKRDTRRLAKGLRPGRAEQRSLAITAAPIAGTVEGSATVSVKVRRAGPGRR